MIGEILGVMIVLGLWYQFHIRQEEKLNKRLDKFWQEVYRDPETADFWVEVAEKEKL